MGGLRSVDHPLIDNGIISSRALCFLFNDLVPGGAYFGGVFYDDVIGKMLSAKMGLYIWILFR